MSYPTRYPPADWRPLDRHHSAGMVLPPRGLIPHVQMGGGSLLGWFNDVRSGVSAHLWLSRAGKFEQYVPFDRRAWAQAAGNPFWISVECEGLDTVGYTDVQVQRLGELFAWGIVEFKWKPEVTDSPSGYGLGTHRMGGSAWGGHSCPGDLRANQRGDILAAALRWSAPAPTGQDRYQSMPLVRPGDEGAAVVHLQNALNIVFGHEQPTGDPNRITPDGDYGPRTQARVASLQRYASPWFGRIPDDGICGPNTWRKLGWILTGMGRAV